jgi:hypothetical protein
MPKDKLKEDNFVKKAEKANELLLKKTKYQKELADNPNKGVSEILSNWFLDQPRRMMNISFEASRYALPNFTIHDYRGLRRGNADKDAVYVQDKGSPDGFLIEQFGKETFIATINERKSIYGKICNSPQEAYDIICKWIDGEAMPELSVEECLLQE